MWVLRFFQTNYKERAKRTGVPQLLTIPYSHYNELAKWSWDVAGGRYEEHAFGPGGHVFPVKSIRTTDECLSDSSYVQVVKPNKLIVLEEAKTKERAKRSRLTAVPVMVLPDGQVLTDSWKIAAASGLLPIPDDNFKKLLDEELGPSARQFAYTYILKNRPHNVAAWNSLASTGFGWAWWILWNMFVGRFVTKIMIKTFQPANEAASNECLEKLRIIFSKMSMQVASKKTKFLYGNEMGLADVAFASLAAAVVMPDEYSRGKYYTLFNKLINDDPEYKLRIDEFRATPAGQYVAQIYKNHRLC